MELGANAPAIFLLPLRACTHPSLPIIRLHHLPNTVPTQGLPCPAYLSSDLSAKALATAEALAKKEAERRRITGDSQPAP